ncbi:MAG: hypothetical protein K8823_1602 [Cenarchaeum symbiont of Oopsacas minuta]|nr:hypothetical protein [Cenarchaeum symbiont of Oopsacas minuta]
MVHATCENGLILLKPIVTFFVTIMHPCQQTDGASPAYDLSFSGSENLSISDAIVKAVKSEIPGTVLSIYACVHTLVDHHVGICYFLIVKVNRCKKAIYPIWP